MVSFTYLYQRKHGGGGPLGEALGLGAPQSFQMTGTRVGSSDADTEDRLHGLCMSGSLDVSNPMDDYSRAYRNGAYSSIPPDVVIAEKEASDLIGRLFYEQDSKGNCARCGSMDAFTLLTRLAFAYISEHRKLEEMKKTLFTAISDSG